MGTGWWGGDDPAPGKGKYMLFEYRIDGGDPVTQKVNEWDYITLPDGGIEKYTPPPPPAPTNPTTGGGGGTTAPVVKPTYTYTKNERKCVNGANIKKYSGKTVDECKAICSADINCVAFEYGVAYGGSGGYVASDCQPNSKYTQADLDACDG